MSAPKTITHLLPTGAIILWGGSDMPNGFLLCNGASVSRSDYPDLADALGETGTTFSLPDYRDRVPQGAGTVSPNVGIGAGIPNCEGTFEVLTSVSNDIRLNVKKTTGVFSEHNTEEIYNVLTGSTSYSELDHTPGRMALSRQTSIYSDDVDTVQPPAWTCHFLVKA